MPENSADPADFLIITALEHEAQAVIRRLVDHRVERIQDRDIRSYHCGRVPIGDGERSYRVVVVLLPGMGELAAANATTDALTYWRPEHVLMIGIAGGIAQDDLDLGDVVVADQVIGYDYGKQYDTELKPRDHVYPVSALLLERIRNFWDTEWPQHIEVQRPANAVRDRAKRFVGPIASGNKVIASKEFQAQLLKRWPKLIAVETEAEGVFAAVFDRPAIKHALVIRGISDMADKAKDDVWQLYAANAAAAYAIAFLKSGPVESFAHPSTAPQRGSAQDASAAESAASINNVSGGVDVDAENVNVGADVVGHDKVTHITYNIQNATITQGEIASSAARSRNDVETLRSAVPPKISTAKLPSTSPDLFGREIELATLDQAWADAHTNIVTLVAWGGVGKSALANVWLNNLAADNYRGATHIFGWSFYSQGARENSQASADQFIAEALKWWGDPDPTQGSPWGKGERLAALIKQSRALLILDGLEPLQSPPPIETGRLKDPALTALLRELARHNPGLVLITTRLAVDDLKDFTTVTPHYAHVVGASVASREAAKQSQPDQEIASSSQTAGLLAMTHSAVQIDLDTLSDEAGAAYLKKLGVIGTSAELQQASHDFAGHALALTLLGTYLTKVHRGEVRKRDLIPHLTDERKQGAHAQRVLASYEHWLNGKAELDILRLMGLFDRPASAGAIAALRKKPVIKGLTDQLQKVNDIDWEYAVSNLRDLRLLSADSDDELDCHPLLREHFGEQLRTTNPKAFREAHRRLYEYYKSAAKELPDTLEEMAPLFAAVMHGCLAGQHQDAFGDVFWERIRRGQEAYSWKKLGAFSSDLAALSGFFDLPWRQPVASLREDVKGFVLNEAGIDLRALGRLAEAAQPMQASLDAYIAQENWAFAARIASNLSELYLTLGDVAQAVKVAQQSVELADRSGEWEVRMGNRTTLAAALHQAGSLPEAEAAFREAEEMQKQNQPTFPLLYSLRGFQYCDLLLNLGQVEEVQRRAGQTLEWAMQYLRSGGSLLAIALDNLSLGRVLTWFALSPNPSPELGRGDARQRGGEGERQALIYLTRAVDGLRQAGDQSYLPRGLLARAEYYRLAGNIAKAQSDLDEVMTIAMRGGMRLHEADCHLGYARLALAQGDKGTARQHLSAARALIDQCGYHRRDGEVQELEAALA